MEWEEVKGMGRGGREGVREVDLREAQEGM
jgi:hypothetical protein